jgi:hypothetical protein
MINNNDNKKLDDNIINTLYYENKELEILKNAINVEAKKRGERIANNPVMKHIIDVLEKFIHDKKLVCYGGTAINNILPTADQFYNRNLEIPDYDFFSPNAMNDAKELADIYYRAGFSDVEAKAGVHYGTYKVFVNFFQIADITQLDNKLFSSLKKNAINKDGILYSPPNFLRMAMYLELSRPGGDITRWEKVLKRLNLLNKNYPLKATGCDPDTFRRSLSSRSYNKQYYYEKDTIHNVIKNIVSSEKLVLIGGYANVLYSRYLKNRERMYLMEIPEFDLLSTTPDKTANAIKTALEKNNIKNITIETKPSIPEYLSTHYEIKVGSQPIAYVYNPLACHSYNSIKVNGQIFRVATIDTMMSFYLLFLYADRSYYNPKRLLCLCEYLFKIQQKNRLKLHGLLRRFSISCYGKQKTLEDIRNEKAKQFKKLKTKKKSREYEKWFLRYSPELNPSNKPYLKLIKSKKTREDIINEAKLALEAKAITSKAVIAELEKIKKKTPTSSSSSPSPSRSFSSSILRRALKTRKINNNSAINRLHNRTRSKRLKMKKHLPSLSNIMSNKKTKKVANKNNEKSKLHKNQINNILIMEDEFVPSKTTNSLTTENIYK